MWPLGDLLFRHGAPERSRFNADDLSQLADAESSASRSKFIDRSSTCSIQLDNAVLLQPLKYGISAVLNTLVY